MARLFTCIWVPEELKQKIINFQNNIKKIPIKAKFVEPENIHITLTFIGDVKNENIDDIKKIIQKTIENIKSFDIKIKGLKLISNEDFIRVIGIKIEDNEDMKNLIRKVGNYVNSKFYDSAKLTLCRVKNISDKNYVNEFIKKNKDIEIGEFKVNKICLVESVLSKNGPTYKTLYEFKLI